VDVSWVMASPLRWSAAGGAHDLARTCLGQVLAKADVLGFGNRSDLFAHVVTQLLGDGLGLVSSGSGRLSTTKAHTASPVVSSRTAHHSGFCHQLGAAHQSGFDFHRAHAVTGHVQHVVDTAGNGEVTGLLVTDGTIASKVVLALEVIGVVALLEALGSPQILRIMEGQGFLHTRIPPLPQGMSLPTSSTTANWMPGKGSVQEPGTMGVAPAWG
jgi:hypothetical protein